MEEMHSLLKPSFVKDEVDCLRVNGELSRTIMAVGYPRTIKEGWLDRIVAGSGAYDVSIHISPGMIDTAITRLNQELVKQEADMLAARMKAIVNPSLRIQHQDTMKVLERLQKGQEKLFSIAMYVNARAQDRQGLELLSRKIVSELNSVMIIPKIPFMRMKDGLKSVIPLQEDRLMATRDITSDALGACFPFTTAFYNKESEGVMLGFNRTSGVPVILDPYSLPNHNGLIIGTSGGGKSFVAKLFIMRNLVNGTKTIIIDPQGEYSRLAAEHNGKIISLGGKKSGSINPFDLLGMEADERAPSVLEFLKILIGGMTAEQETLLLNILPKVLNGKHKARKGSGRMKKNFIRRSLGGLYEEIISGKGKAAEHRKGVYESLEARLRPFVDGPLSVFNATTHVDLGSTLTCFDVSRLPERLRPAAMFLIMDFVHHSMQGTPGRKMLLVDEAWSLLRVSEGASHVFGLIKTARKFGLSVVIITQEAEDLVSTDAGRAILANTAWKFFARQEPAVIDDLAKKFRLNEEEKALLLTAVPGEGLLFALNDHLPLKVVASPEEYRHATTRPEEVEEQKANGTREK